MTPTVRRGETRCAIDQAARQGTSVQHDTRPERRHRLSGVVQIAVVGPGGENVAVPGGEAETIAKSVIIACWLARAIISHASGSRVDEEISRITLVHIDEALERAKQSFPELNAATTARRGPKQRTTHWLGVGRTRK